MKNFNWAVAIFVILMCFLAGNMANILHHKWTTGVAVHKDTPIMRNEPPPNTPDPDLGPDYSITDVTTSWVVPDKEWPQVLICTANGYSYRCVLPEDSDLKLKEEPCLTQKNH